MCRGERQIQYCKEQIPQVLSAFSYIATMTLQRVIEGDDVNCWRTILNLES